MKEDLKELRELLVVVDMVNGFIRNGALADQSVGHIIPRQVEMIEDFIRRKQGVLFINDTHTDDSIEFKYFPPHCIKGSGEEELVDELKPYEDYAMKIEKNSTSAIFAGGFLKLIDEMINLKRVIGVGCESDICVPNLFIPLKNYFNEHNRDVDVIVCEDAVETYDAPFHDRTKYHEASLLLMNQAGIKLVKTYKGEN